MKNSPQKIPLLFENELCLVFNKPSGLSVQGGEGVKISLDSILSQQYSPRPLLVHRLDRDTSGVILVAKTKEAARFFSALFAGPRAKAGGVSAIYTGLCSGIPKPEQGVIKLDLDEKGRGQTRVVKKSETFYRCLSVYSAGSNETITGGFFSLLELELGTGRLHQIRRHLALKGHPLLGDDKYGDFSLNKKLRKTSGLKHLLLHAARISIAVSAELPDGLDVSAPLPDYFSGFLESLTS